MGIGVYAMFASDDFQDASLILNELLDDELGFEAYYNFAVTPWLQVSADVQWVDQGISTSDDAWVVGSRLTIRF
jgi:porin